MSTTPKQVYTANPAYLKYDMPPIKVDGPLWCSLCEEWYDTKTGKKFLFDCGL